MVNNEVGQYPSHMNFDQYGCHPSDAIKNNPSQLLIHPSSGKFKFSRENMIKKFSKPQ
ncbi:hypothetical protein QG37_05183 [Candidozyma auris]|uniref:Uncharacterized protein n=1 Tax=Candidozyma auris TaxID=498019 RepID=A0A0L0NUW2_CANAR|nr:hypothetical protein QG37_05183 [[Candida] auris]